MRLWIAYVDSLDTPWSPDLCANSAEVKSFGLEAEEGGLYVASVEVKNRGLAFLAPDMPRFAWISWSPTNFAEHGVPLARGYFDGVPTDLSANFATIRIVCAPKDIDAKLKAAAASMLPKVRAGEHPAQRRDYYFDPLVVEDKSDLREAMLEARPHAWHVDPYTHAISLSHIIAGERFFDLGRRYDNSKEPPILTTVDGDPPARTVKVKVVAEWTQQAQGWCDIAPALNLFAPFISLNPDVIAAGGRGQPNATVDYQTGAGWSHDKDLISQWNAPFANVPSGYVYEQELQDYIKPAGAPTQNLGTRKVLFPERISIQSTRWQWVYNWLSYTYTQPRREEAIIVLTYPLADIATAMEELVLDDIVAGDLLLPEGLSIWETGKAYDIGDQVIYAGKCYRAIKNHVSTTFWKNDPRGWQYRGTGRYELPAQHPEWKEIPSPAAMPDARSSIFLDTPRGTDLIAHCVHRAHKVGIQRSRYLRLQLRFAWRDAIHVRCTDRVRVEMRGRSGTLQPVEGKVEKLKWSWQHRNATVTLTLRIPLGDGTAADPFTPLRAAYPGLPIGYLTDAPENTSSGYVAEDNSPDVPEDNHPDVPEDNTPDVPADPRLITGYVPEDPRLGGGTGIGAGQGAGDDADPPWWGDGTYPDSLPGSVATPEPQPTSSEVAWAIEPDRVVQPVDPFLLDSSSYAVFHINYQNPGNRQLTEARGYGLRGIDARLAIDEQPTRVSVIMRSLDQYDTLTRKIDVPAHSLLGRRGIDLVAGGNP